MLILVEMSQNWVYSDSPRRENAALWPMLFSSLSWDISCSMCLLTGGVNSPPTGFHSYLWALWRRAYKPSPPPAPPSLSPWLSCVTSYLVSPFFPLFHASEHCKWEYAFNECFPSPVSRALFTFTSWASSLSLSLVPAYVCKCTFHQRSLWWL